MEHGNRLLYLDVFLVTFSTLTLVSDYAICFFTIVMYQSTLQYTIAITATIQALVSGLLTSIMNCVWLGTNGSHHTVSPRMPMVFHIFRILTIVFLISPLSGYFNAFYFLWKRHQAIAKGEIGAAQRTYDAVVTCLSEVSLLRFIQSLIAIIPLSVLHLYVMAQHIKTKQIEGWPEILINILSVSSTSIAMTTYDRSLRQLQTEEAALSLRATIVLFFAYSSSLGARLLAVGLFASLSITFTCVILAVHWLVMALWLMLPVYKAYWCRPEKLLVCFALATAYVFAFFNQRGETGTRYKHLFYYSVSFVGNTAMMIMWFRNPDYLLSGFHQVVLLVGHYALFITGLVLLVTHQFICHWKKAEHPEPIALMPLRRDNITR